jgi:hypothetical protein
MCYNLKPFKLDDEDPLSILKTNLKKNLFQLPFIIVKIDDFYGNIRIAYNSIWMVKYLLTIDFIHICN